MSAPSIHTVDVYPYRRREGRPAEFLMLRRSAGRVYAGAWRMVGGKIEPGERAWEAALRELREETALAPVRFWALPSVNAFYEWQRDAVVLAPAFAAEVGAGAEPVLDSEHDAWAWLPPEAAAGRLAWPEQRRLLRLAARLANAGGAAPELEIPLPGGA